MKILVTGANGQLGQTLQDVATASNHEFVFATRHDLDITDRQQVTSFLEKNTFDVIINAAAYTDVDGAEANRELAVQINHEGPMWLAGGAKKHNSWLIYISTDYVFPGNGCIPYREGSIPSPCNAYGKTKSMGEAPVLRYKRGIVIRTSWLYSFCGKNFVRTILKLADERDEIKVVTDQIGCPTSAWSLSKGILTLISNLDQIEDREKRAGADERIFHYADSGVASWYDFAQAIIDIKNRFLPSGFEIKCKVIPTTSKDFPRPARRPYFSVLDTNKFQTMFGQVPPYWRESLAAVLETPLEELLPPSSP
jgi:dTDP-4-dehydrorhamnose reductase